MSGILREHADAIVRGAISAVLPEAAVLRALEGKRFSGRIILVSVGKAAWRMAKAAGEALSWRMEKGIVLTKYGHVMGELPRCTCIEAGHPVPDENSFRGTQAVIDLVSGLSPSDTVLFLLSGGGSALFEKPLLPDCELKHINNQLLSCGADIVEINTIRKRLSAVKGGRFAGFCGGAHIEAIALSDVMGDRADMIASGPVSPDPSTAEDAKRIIQKYGIELSEAAKLLMSEETPKTLENVSFTVSGSVRELCRAAAKECAELGYTPVILTDSLCCEAREAGSFLASILKTHAFSEESLAFIAGGETVVRLRGSGKGGRNQELALSAALGIAGMENAAVFSFGSDGTDGPTDAAGGFADGTTAQTLSAAGISIERALSANDAYNALKACGGLIVTGPTGTNVNDAAVALLKRGRGSGR